MNSFPFRAPFRAAAFLAAASVVAIGLALAGCGLLGLEPDPDPNPEPGQTVTIAGPDQATQASLRAIPDSAVAAARAGLHVAYFHTSHGTHVSYGLFGLPGFRPELGDAARFAVTNHAAAPDPAALDFHDESVYSPGATWNGYPDLSQADADWSGWVDQNRDYLDAAANAGINVMMWSWCNIAGHDAAAYLASMQTLIDEYGAGGSKIGTGAGKTRTLPVDFVFMTGHGDGFGFDDGYEDGGTALGNIGYRRPEQQAQAIIDYCAARGYWCLDYYGIDTHDMAGNYWRDAGDDGESLAYAQSLDPAAASAGSFYADWQTAGTLGGDWYQNRSSPGGETAYGEHLSQDVTANRKAFAFWWLAARIAGWR